MNEYDDDDDDDDVTYRPRNYRKLVKYGNVWRWPHVGRQYRKSVASEFPSFQNYFL